MTSSTKQQQQQKVDKVDGKVVKVIDSHLQHVWLLEPQICCSSNSSSSSSSNHTNVLTADGISQIVHHKYVAGVYTNFDVWLNPMWQWLTDNILPIWLAPNTVTALGGLCCLMSVLGAEYLLFWNNNNNNNNNDNNSTIATIHTMNGICLLVYYTLDCMDGKQARRTNSSSPLGQLFDHGVDCLANLSHVRLLAALLSANNNNNNNNGNNTINFMIMLYFQIPMQLGFFQAQWEEYYTGRLPHAAGNFGTTEVLYGMGVWSLTSGIMGFLNIDLHIYDTALPEAIQQMLESYSIVTKLIVNDAMTVDENVNDIYTIRHLMVLIWVYGFGVLSLLSLGRVLQDIPSHLYGTAMSKLIMSPCVVCGVAFWYCHDISSSSSSLSGNSNDIVKACLLALGTLLCFLTIKLIVFGMAKMAYASIQPDIVPFILLVGICKTTLFDADDDGNTIKIAFYVLALGYAIRLILWTKAAMKQLCDKLQIQAFTISTKKVE